ncbi:MAG TPA: M56 family metallopeptidase [Vicinamibacterales bacterium]|nr:M56 family metallopeptidase [Vicinamibacterales bacterium]
MRLVLSSALLAAFWFAVANVIASAIAWVAARVIDARGRNDAGLLVAIRLMPAAAAIFFATALFLPAHWLYEPAESEEAFGVAMSVLAAFGAALMMRSAWRALTVVSQDLRVASLTRRSATPLDAGAYQVRGLHGVSLAGVLRPTILVGSAAVEALTPAELDAAIAHEIAHQRSRDNLKRFLMHCAPDLFGWSAAARRIEQAWQAESECEADARAVRGDERRAVVLASALVKVARLTRRPGVIVPSPAWSAFHVPTLLETRVARLVSGRLDAARGFRSVWCGIAAAAFGVPAAVWTLNLAYPLHLVTEALVSRLP